MTIKSTVQPIINNLYEAKVVYEKWQITGIAETSKDAEKKVLKLLKREVEIHYEQLEQSKGALELVDKEVLKVFKMPISQLANAAEHYFLSETPNLDNSIGWGPNGLELLGKVRVTKKQLERITEFTEDPRFDGYKISKNNCEHFANYVYCGLHYSSQQEENGLKNIASKAIEYVQPTQSLAEIINQNISDCLQNNLRKAKLESFYDEYCNICKMKGFDELLLVLDR